MRKELSIHVARALRVTSANFDARFSSFFLSSNLQLSSRAIQSGLLRAFSTTKNQYSSFSTMSEIPASTPPFRRRSSVSDAQRTANNLSKTYDGEIGFRELREDRQTVDMNDRYDRRIAELEAEGRHWRDKYEEEKRQRELAQRDNRIWQERAASWKSQVSLCQARSRRTASQRREIVSQVHGLQRDRERLIAEVNSLRSALDGARGQVTSLDSTLSSVQADNSELTVRVENLEWVKTRLASLLQGAEDDYDELAAVGSKLSRQLEEAEDSVKKWKARFIQVCDASSSADESLEQYLEVRKAHDDLSAIEGACEAAETLIQLTRETESYIRQVTGLHNEVEEEEEEEEAEEEEEFGGDDLEVDDFEEQAN